MRILFAEEDYSTRKFMMKMLSEYGECEETVNGEEVIDVFMCGLEEGEPYDLVCVDLNLDILDGNQVLKTIRDIETERGIGKEDRVKVILTGAFNKESNEKKFSELGSDGYLDKPIDAKKLERMLQQLKLV